MCLKDSLWGGGGEKKNLQWLKQERHQMVDCKNPDLRRQDFSDCLLPLEAGTGVCRTHTILSLSSKSRL